MSAVLSEYVPVRKPAMAKAARRWGACQVVQGKQDAPRILRDPFHFRRMKAELERKRRCHMCDGSGEILVEISEYEQQAEPCPVCNTDWVQAPDDDGVPF